MRLLQVDLVVPCGLRSWCWGLRKPHRLNAQRYGRAVMKGNWAKCLLMWAEETESGSNFAWYFLLTATSFPLEGILSMMLTWSQISSFQSSRGMAWKKELRKGLFLWIHSVAVNYTELHKIYSITNGHFAILFNEIPSYSDLGVSIYGNNVPYVNPYLKGKK